MKVFDHHHDGCPLADPTPSAERRQQPPTLCSALKADAGYRSPAGNW